MYFGSNRGWMAMGWLAIVGLISIMLWLITGIAFVAKWVYQHVRVQ